jgi:FkbM family methyltransferase
MLVDKEITDFFISIQDILKPDISIEVGAFEAYFSNEMIKRVKSSFAFEASPYVHNEFKNKVSKDIQYLNVAVSDKSGKEDFEIQTNHDYIIGNNSIKKRNDNSKKLYVEVDSVSLNDFFKDSKFLKACLWIDCEGASKEVLTGASNILNKVQSIFIEAEKFAYWNDQWLSNDIEKFLKDYNFIVISRHDQYEKQENIVFINNKIVNKDDIDKIKGMWKK